ncbi:MAG: hypothetical protein IMW90_18200 [Thermogemmatispora sp.]|uniref:type ISP restriction/modification enzyme n=1 Tax=Thermogemmatispora sp. TaxID=1968838 RepID=UPI0019FAACDD|nr:hypothetical protein [Thermogemmatispora sp.]
MAGSNRVERVAFVTDPSSEQGRVWINVTQSFAGVPEEVWTFEVGGDQVCAQWLKWPKVIPACACVWPPPSCFITRLARFFPILRRAASMRWPGVSSMSCHRSPAMATCLPLCACFPRRYSLLRCFPWLALLVEASFILGGAWSRGVGERWSCRAWASWRPS